MKNFIIFFLSAMIFIYAPVLDVGAATTKWKNCKKGKPSCSEGWKTVNITCAHDPKLDQVLGTKYWSGGTY